MTMHEGTSGHETLAYIVDAPESTVGDMTFVRNSMLAANLDMTVCAATDVGFSVESGHLKEDESARVVAQLAVPGGADGTYRHLAVIEKTKAAGKTCRIYGLVFDEASGKLKVHPKRSAIPSPDLLKEEVTVGRDWDSMSSMFIWPGESDPERLSGRHVTLDASREGKLLIRETSTNGTYIKLGAPERSSGSPVSSTDVIGAMRSVVRP